MDEGKELKDILEGRFIKRVMQTAALDINLAQVKYMNTAGFNAENSWYSGRSFEATESGLQVAQMLRHRVVDMKFISPGMGRFKKKSHPIYNKIMYGHYNNIVRELKYGFTDAIKEELRQLEE